MQYSNELKVGAALVLAALVFFAGIRFFQDMPLFQGSYTLNATFEEAGGLGAGNPVVLKGVNVGSVESVRLDQEEQVVRVTFRVDKEVRVPEGSNVRVTGFSGISGVRLVIEPGPADNPALAAGATLSPPAKGSLLERLSDQAPAIASKADSVLTNTNSAMAGLQEQLQNPESDLRGSLRALRGTMQNMEQITEAEKESIRSLMDNLEAISADLRQFTGERGDSLNVAVDRVNRSLVRLNRTLTHVENTSATLDDLTTKMNNGTGTVGRLLNDPSLYVRFDTTAARTNRILRDFEDDPSRYLKDMTLVRMF